MSRNSFLLAFFCAAIGAVPAAKADIVSIIPEYNGPSYFDFNPLDYPLPSVLIGEFSFSIPAGQTVIGATISGTFGNADVEPDTALSDYFVGSGAVQVAGCDDTSDPCFSGDGSFTPIPWSYTFTSADLASLAAEFSAGSLDFTVVQNFAISVQTGATTLDIQTAPEPASIFLLSGVLASLGISALRRKRNLNPSHV